MKKKRRLFRILVALLVVVLYIGSAAFTLFSSQQEAPVLSEADELSQPQEEVKETAPLPETVERCEAENEREDAETPRDKYGLSFPTTTRSEQMLSATLKKREQKSMSYFDGSLFIGDSVTLGLQNYVTSMRQSDPSYLGSARFLAIGSYGAAEAVRDPTDESSIHKIVGGKKIPPESFVAEYGVSKVFIALGLNDVGIYEKSEYLQNYKTLISNIRDVAPNVKIIIVSITPLTLYGERRVLYNAKIDEYNEALALFSAENSCFFADVSYYLKDNAGYLAKSYCSDDYCHLEAEAYGIWVEYLQTHTVDE